MNYVVGFKFSPGGEFVALIRKTKPAWQAGLLNGVGGKIEPNETSMESVAMQRPHLKPPFFAHVEYFS